MEIDVVFRWPDLLPEEAEGRVAVVIDVLRATSMIAALLAAGAREVWPVKEVDEARRLASELGGALPGERGGLPRPVLTWATRRGKWTPRCRAGPWC